MNVGPGTYWLFPQSNFLSGTITVYASDQCEAAGSTTQNIGADGYVHTADGLAMASAICNAAHADGAYTARQQAFNANVWVCQELPPTATNTAIPPTATNTTIPPTNTTIRRHRRIRGRLPQYDFQVRILASCRWYGTRPRQRRATIA